MKTSICLSLLPAPQAAKRSVHCAVFSVALSERFQMSKPTRANTPKYALLHHLHVRYLTLNKKTQRKGQNSPIILKTASRHTQYCCNCQKSPLHAVTNEVKTPRRLQHPQDNFLKENSEHQPLVASSAIFQGLGLVHSPSADPQV